MSQAPDPRALARTLEECLRAILELRQHLCDERQALERQDGDALAAASDGKRACAARLDTLERERAALCGAPLEQMPAWLARRGAGVRSATDWRRFLEIAAECDRLNTANGAVIHLRQRQISAALNILDGRGAPPETYEPAGNRPASRSSRSLVTI